MRNLICADIHRLLRKKIFWFVLAALCVSVTMSVVHGMDEAPDPAYCFAVAASDGVGYVTFFLGFALVLGVYAEDFKSMTFINVIGRGLSREKLILARALESYLILLGFYAAAGVLTAGLCVAYGVQLSSLEVLYIFVRSLEDFLCTGASVMMAAVFFFLTENTTLGVFMFLCAEIMIPVALELIFLMPSAARFHPERLYVTGAASIVGSDFLLGATAEGLLALALVVAVYIVGAVAAAVALFRKKELNF